MIDGRAYRPAPDGVPYTGQLDGRRCLFGRHVLPDGTLDLVATLWGVWDPGEREYLKDRGPHRIDGRFPFATWSAVEE